MSEQGFYAFAQGQPSEHVEWSGSATIIQTESWTDRAACLTVDPDAFFPEKGKLNQIREAKAICDSCPVKAACGEYAFRTKQEHGIWGGLTVEEFRGWRK